MQTNISAVEVMELVSDLRDTVGNATEEGVGQNPTNLKVVDEVLRTVRRFLEENEGFAEPGADEEVCIFWSLILQDMYIHNMNKMLKCSVYCAHA